MPQEAKSASRPIDADQHAQQGTVVPGSDPTVLAHGIEMAFNYRGDVTILRRSSPEPIEGYVSNRKGEGDRASLTLIPRDSNEHLQIPYGDVAELRFTGRDTAAGKSFETWMKKYVEKKLAGQVASIEAESLDSD